MESPQQQRDMQSVYEIKVSKPTKLAFTMVSGQLGGIAKSDGQHVYLYSPQLGMYTISDTPTDLSQLFVKQEFSFVSGGFTGLSLLEALVSPDPYAAIMQGVTGAKLVGTEKIDGVESQHVHFSQRELSWDLWVNAGKEPWVRRVVPDVSGMLKSYPGASPDTKMELTLNYTDLKQNPELAAADFDFKPADGAREVASFFKTAEAQEAEDPLQHKPAPDISLDTLSGGKFDLSSHKSKDVVVLYFWATWCPPCHKAFPVISEIVQAYQDKGVQFYAINEMEDPSKVQDYLKLEGLNVNVAIDKTGQTGVAYFVKAIPKMVIVGKDGVVHAVQIGLAPNLKELFTSQLDAIVAGKEPVAQ
jgi:peroxiredoxin